MYSSIRYLGEDTEFDTKLLGWTGEIIPKSRKPRDRRPTVVSPKLANGVANGQLDDIAPPRQTDVDLDEPAKELVSLTAAQKETYTRKLNDSYNAQGSKYEMIPIWTLEDADGKPKNSTAETPETQSRFRKYAEQGIYSVKVLFTCSSVAIVALRAMERN